MVPYPSRSQVSRRCSQAARLSRMSSGRSAGNRYGNGKRVDTRERSKRVGSSRYSRTASTDSKSVPEVGRMIATKLSPGFRRATSSTRSYPCSNCGPSTMRRMSQAESLLTLTACAGPSPSFLHSTNRNGRRKPHATINDTSRSSAWRRVILRCMNEGRGRVCHGHQIVTPVMITETTAALAEIQAETSITTTNLPRKLVA